MATTVTDRTIAGLRAARSLIEKGWTQGAFAETADGLVVSVPFIDPTNAAMYCAAGACMAVTRDRWGGDLAPELDRQLQQEGHRAGVENWNDEPARVQADVLQLFDRTIARLEAEAS